MLTKVNLTDTTSTVVVSTAGPGAQSGHPLVVFYGRTEAYAEHMHVLRTGLARQAYKSGLLVIPPTVKTVSYAQ